MNRTEIFAHRGASAYAPENTIPAFILAYEQGADGIELDVQLTKDGEVVVIHDETINRVSNGKGAVKDYTLEELRQFSFCNHMPEYAADAQIPTLEETLRLAAPWGIKVNIELKTGIFCYPGIEEKTMEIVRKEGMDGRVIYSSFNHYSIRKIQKLAPKAETAYLFADVMLGVADYAGKGGVSALHPALYHVDHPEFWEECRNSGLPLRVWTVDDEADLERMFLSGAAAVFTNKPDVAVKVRRKHPPL